MKPINVWLTPDGYRYFAVSKKRVIKPFHLRWFLPFVLKDNLQAWAWVTRLSIVGFAILTAVYCQNPWMVSVALLPGIVFSWKCPVLVDAFGMFLALLACVLLPIYWPAAVAVALLAGCVRETAPIWSAVYAWNPILLVGMIPVAIRWLQKEGPDVLDEKGLWIVKHPFKASKEFHAGKWMSPQLMLTPWAGLILGLGAMTPQLFLALLLAYSQLLIATDSVRLYQWATPVLALATCNLLPVWAIPFVAVSIVFNPWKGDGI